jgi:TonB family protein
MLRRLAGTWFLLSICSFSSFGQTSANSTSILRVKKFVGPAYPAAARKNRMQGTTATELHVRSDGTVDSVKVVMSHPVFHDYVEAALRRWVFEPATGSGNLRVTVSFKLQACDEGLRSTETRIEADFPDLVEVTACLDPVVTSIN